MNVFTSPFLSGDFLVDSDSIITEKDIESFLDLKYAGPEFREGLPFDTGRDLPMCISVLELLLTQDIIEPNFRSILLESIKAKVEMIKEGQFIIKVPIKNNEYSLVFLRGSILNNTKWIVRHLLDSFFEPLVNIPILLNQTHLPINQYIYRCRLKGTLPLTNIDKNSYTPCVVQRNF